MKYYLKHVYLSLYPMKKRECYTIFNKYVYGRSILKICDVNTYTKDGGSAAECEKEICKKTEMSSILKSLFVLNRNK